MAAHVTCKYHGWVFEPESGQCMEIPSLTSQDSYPRRIYATAFPCRERDGYAWVYIPKPGTGRVRMEARDVLPLYRNCQSSAIDTAALI